MIKAYSSNNLNHCHIIKQMLEENNINVVLLNKQDSSYLMFGQIELYVHEDDIKETKLLIQKNNYV